MAEETGNIGMNVGISFRLSCVLGEQINAKFLRACAAEFVASFVLVWLITGVSSGIGYLPIPKDISSHHMMATSAQYENYNGKFKGVDPNTLSTTGSIFVNQYGSTAYSTGQGASPNNNFYGSNLGLHGSFQSPIGQDPTGTKGYQMFPQTNVMAMVGPVGGVLNALGYETGLNFGFDRTIGYSLVYGLALAFLSYCIVDLSGAHINPIVSLALAISGNCTWLRAFFYWWFQFGGAVAGAGWLKLSVGPTMYLGGLLTRLPIEPGHGWLLEFWGTVIYLLPYLFFAPWSARTFENPWKLGTTVPSSLGPLVVGLALCVASIVVHPFTGCAFNPARAVGAATFEQRRFGHRTATKKPFAVFGFPTHWWIYWVGPIGAAVVTPLVYIAIVGTASNVDPFRVYSEIEPVKSFL